MHLIVLSGAFTCMLHHIKYAYFGMQRNTFNWATFCHIKLKRKN
jgi:hypothetical protein